MNLNLRIAIPLTMIASFALTCGISLWVERVRDHSSGDQPFPTPENVGVERKIRLPPVEPLSSEPPARTSAARILATTQAAAAAAQAPDPAEPIYAKTELPVEFLYERSPDKTYVLNLMNRIEKVITLEISIINPSSGHTAEAQVTLGPSQAKQIGDDSLEIEAGDRITLHNPSYNDMVQEIRGRPR